ncbi:LysM peptidoglycan-binding domain-containing protein [Flavobacterium luminosum]|uniref:LysM peptidoglycan-binding domain-containing protein n=1 Tax=Flavobacterium luminosum TaxID=2949086 RepID=A0ABT0TLH9_9FLAO|nr:LysM peptidoglycan-binding domain-containing protein [Flavobacterium sp. HXWNR70]MCL9808346.1 LysM peptidoglycan-binding domain-containing protein [Flavobacterium sp. HXWNR70]
MIKKKLALSLLTFLLAYNGFSQESKPKDSVIQPEIKRSFLDSIKNTFVVDETSNCIDNQCIKELSSTQDIFDGLLSDIKNLDLNVPVDYEFSTDVFKERLRLMDEKSPFHIDYNPQLENLVKNFLKNRKRSYERLMGLSHYYFPMFEEAMARHNVPLEIKYLAIVESALNSKAVSRMGATGLWQFMFQTGKQYGLRIDSYVDERSDAYKASDAAARYMAGMYKIFGDWELVLASYNSGAGNVTKAIRRSGGFQNFWNIKSKLPKETQGYVPAFLATMYIFEYHKEHGIVPQKPVANHLEVDTIAVKKNISFKQLSDLLDIPVPDLEFLNPSYKMKVVPYITGRTNFITLPKNKIAVFASNEDKIYAYVDYEESKREKRLAPKQKKEAILPTAPVEEALVQTTKTTKSNARTKFHTVRPGDNLGAIASKYGVTVKEIKDWNNMRSTALQSGRKLKIQVKDTTSVQEEAIAQVDSGVNKVAKTKSPVVAETNLKKSTAIAEHTVSEGETLTTIAKKYRMYVADLKKINNLKESTVKVGDKLKLKATIDNVDKAEQIEEAVASNDTKENIHTVKKGENIFQIAKIYKVGVDDILNWNNLTTTNINVGDELKIEKVQEVVAETPKKKINKFEEQRLYIVQKGDSLFKISQKHNITVAELKKKNNIKDNELQPGMKLKI